MREKNPVCIITFVTTTAAMAMEKICREEEIPGRLVPVPRKIRAGCGMCWAAPLQAREEIEELVIRHCLAIDGIYDMML